MPELVIDAIPTGGKSNNKPDSIQLSQRFGISERGVRRIIADARGKGNVILADHGYYFPDKSDEKDRETLGRIYHREKSRAISIFKNLKSTRRLMGEIEDDEALENLKRIAEEMNGKK